MNDKRTSMVEKVRAMLAKAADTPFPAEADSYTEAAMRLMAQYEIAERELRDAGPHEANVLDLTHFGNAGTGAAALACWIADLFGGYGVLWSVGDGKSGRVKITSTAPVLERTQLMLDHLLPQLRADLTKDRPRSRKSYSLGWAQRVVDRLTELQHIAYSDSTALVPTNSEAKRAYEEENGKAPTSRSTQVRSGDWHSGTSRGDQADLNQTRIPA